MSSCHLPDTDIACIVSETDMFVVRTQTFVPARNKIEYCASRAVLIGVLGLALYTGNLKRTNSPTLTGDSTGLNPLESPDWNFLMAWQTLHRYMHECKRRSK